MKYVKILGLLAVAATALMAVVATASADVATSPAGTTYTSTFKAQGGGHVVLDNPIAKIECASTVEGSITGHGAGKPVSGPISTLTFGSPVGTCTNVWHVTVIAGGTLSVDNNGTSSTVTSNGATVESTRLGIICRYATSNTKIGTFTGGTPAAMHIVASIPFHSGSGLCGSGATTWTGGYDWTTPGSLFVDNT